MPEQRVIFVEVAWYGADINAVIMASIRHGVGCLTVWGHWRILLPRQEVFIMQQEKPPPVDAASDKPARCNDCPHETDECAGQPDMYCNDPFADFDAPEAGSLFPAGRRQRVYKDD
jgi:hypothetical protein